MKPTLAVAVAVLAIAVPAAAQVQNTIGPGPITPTHLPIADTDNTPGPSAGDMAIPISISNGMLLVGTPAGQAVIGMSNPEVGTGRPMTFMIENHPGELQTIMFTGFDSMDRPTNFAMNVNPKTTVPGKKALGVALGRSGTAALHPLNQQGFHDGISGQETGGAGFSFDVSFTHMDVTGDGKPDYISIPWADAMAIGGRVQAGGSGGLAHQVWSPLADTGKGVPDSIVMNIPGGNFFPSPPLAPAPQQMRIPASVPTLSGWGLIFLSLGLVVFGWLQLRRGGVSIGF